MITGELPSKYHKKHEHSCHYSLYLQSASCHSYCSLDRSTRSIRIIRFSTRSTRLSIRLSIRSTRSFENPHARDKVDSILLPHMQKSREALTDARKSIQ